MRAQIRVVEGDQKGQTISLDGRNVLIVGRAEHNDLRINHPEVSRTHCRIERFGALWRIVDLNSHNGTFLNGERIRERILSDGDEIRVGRCVLRVELSDTRKRRFDLAARLRIPPALVPVLLFLLAFFFTLIVGWLCRTYLTSRSHYQRGAIQKSHVSHEIGSKNIRRVNRRSLAQGAFRPQPNRVAKARPSASRKYASPCYLGRSHLR